MIIVMGGIVVVVVMALMVPMLGVMSQVRVKFLLKKVAFDLS